jgi:hypothetical protein
MFHTGEHTSRYLVLPFLERDTSSHLSSPSLRFIPLLDQEFTQTLFFVYFFFFFFLRPALYPWSYVRLRSLQTWSISRKLLDWPTSDILCNGLEPSVYLSSIDFDGFFIHWIFYLEWPSTPGELWLVRTLTACLVFILLVHKELLWSIFKKLGTEEY